MKKKVLFVTNHFQFSDGVASVLRSLILNLNPEEYEISLLPIYKFDKKFAEPIINKIKVVNGFGFYFRGMDKIINLLPPMLLYKIFIHEDYDLEIAFQFGIPTKMISISKAKKLCWMHTFDAKMKLRKYYERYPLVVNVAKAGMNKMIQCGFDEKMCEYAYNIIDESFILPRLYEEVSLFKRRKYVLVTVARLAPDKAFKRYFECINKVKNQIDNLEFWIIGGGPDESELISYVEKNNLKHIIKMTGKQNNPFAYLKKADAYFCCSYREGFSTSCQEAAICGLPIVSVNVDGANELAEIADCGEVIDNTEEAICDELVRLSSENLITDWKVVAEKNKIKFYKESRINKIENILNSQMEG